VLEPENAALAAAKIFGISHPPAAHSVRRFQENQRRRLEEADNQLKIED
jgi:phosphoribosylcarboxyaminoimidazole (NCAIR) mutase